MNAPVVWCSCVEKLYISGYIEGLHTDSYYNVTIHNDSEFSLTV